MKTIFLSPFARSLAGRPVPHWSVLQPSVDQFVFRFFSLSSSAAFLRPALSAFLLLILTYTERRGVFVRNACCIMSSVHVENNIYFSQILHTYIYYISSHVGQFRCSNCNLRRTNAKFCALSYHCRNSQVNIYLSTNR